MIVTATGFYHVQVVVTKANTAHLLAGLTSLSRTTIVTAELPIPENFQRWISADTELAARVFVFRAIDFGQRNRRIGRHQVSSSVFVLWSKTFAVAAPKSVQTLQTRGHCTATCCVHLPWGKKLNQHDVVLLHFIAEGLVCKFYYVAVCDDEIHKSTKE